eukprot:UN21801
MFPAHVTILDIMDQNDTIRADFEELKDKISGLKFDRMKPQSLNITEKELQLQMGLDKNISIVEKEASKILKHSISCGQSIVLP